MAKKAKKQPTKVSTRPDVPNPYIDDIVRKHISGKDGKK